MNAFETSATGLVLSPRGFGTEVREYFITDFSNWEVLADGQSLQTATRPPLNPPLPVRKKTWRLKIQRNDFVLWQIRNMEFDPKQNLFKNLPPLERVSAP
ncbi:MAG TPA: hypothetical protein VF430_00385 [Verrucomicrobiae bacterium]|jgi:hypothetical protein